MTPPDLNDLKWLTASLYAVAMVVTSFRLYLRLKNEMWCLDDTFALVGMLSMSILVVGTFILASNANEPKVAFYPILVGYYMPIWCARLSVLFTTIRFAPWPGQRKILLSIAGFFFLQWGFLMAQAVFMAQHVDPTWRIYAGNQPKVTSITQVLTTVISDLILVVSPIWILHDAQLSSGLRFRLVSVFSISVATTIAAIVHVAASLTVGQIRAMICGVIEVFVAMSVCNASALIPAVLRRFSSNETFSEDFHGTVFSTIIRV